MYQVRSVAFCLFNFMEVRKMKKMEKKAVKVEVPPAIRLTIKRLLKETPDLDGTVKRCKCRMGYVTSN